jgi:hypothetical protein
MYDLTLPEFLELKQVNDIQEALQKAQEIDQKTEEEMQKSLER